MQRLPTPPSVLNNNMLPPNNIIVNSSVKSSVSNPQIIGISSIMNANSQIRPMTNPAGLLTNSTNRPIHQVQTVPNPASSVPKPVGSSPQIRIVTNTGNAKTVNPLHNPHLTSHSQFLNNAMTQNTIVRTQQPLTRINPVSVTGASTAIHNLASIASEQKPLTVLPNGNMHNSNHSVVKSDTGNQISVANSVTQGIRHTSSVITGQQQLIKGVNAMNQNLVTVRNANNNVRQPMQHVVVRASVATTLANSSSSVQVVNASQAGSPSTLRPAVNPQIRPSPVRISNPVRVSQHPSIAPRQQTSQTQGTLTIPHGALLMRNESGQLVLVSAPQTVLQQNTSSNSVITTVAPSTGYRIQSVRPLTSAQASVRGAGSGSGTVNIQSQATPQQQQQRPQQQVVQVRTNSISTLQQSQTQQHQQIVRPTGAVTNQTMGHSPTPVIRQPQAAVHSGEMSMAMHENVNKCKNFLSTLIRLAYNQPAATVKNVQALIQGLIDGRVEPEVFTERLQQELQSSPQPYLVPFLKKSLPLLRHCMLKGQMSIDGIKPPPATALTPQRNQVQSVTASQVTVSSSGGLVATARGTTPQQRPSLPNQQAAALQQQQHMKIRTSLGPQSSRLASVRASTATVRPQTPQHIVRPMSSVASRVASSSPQVTITPGGGKVVVHASPQPQLQQAQVKPKASPKPSAGSVRKPSTGSPAAGAMKSDSKGSLGPAPREKRKFESIKDGDDDFNDVATMGGVNLSEESKNILATTNADFIGAQSRSCKDEIFLGASPLLMKISAMAKKHGIDEVSPAVVNLISHATQERLRDLVSKLSTTAEHRVEIYKVDGRFEAVSEMRQKLKFMEELDKLEKKRHEEQEREKLLRAIKSRSKNEDPEQLKLKQKAKELQQAEAEELRQKEANLTALAAIGPRKKRKLDFADSSQAGTSTSNSLLNSSTGTPRANSLRPRIKRVNMRDLQLVLESEKQTRKSDLLYKTFLK